MTVRVREVDARSARRSRRASVAGIVILIVSLACIAVITLSPAGPGQPLPFWCIRCGARPAVDVLLNILMFTPIGAGLALLRVRARWAVLLIVITTLGIEALQYAVIEGRFPSARDIVANTLGGIVAWRIFLDWRAIVFPRPVTAIVLGQVAVLSWLVTQLFTAWSLHLDVPEGPWWAQIKLRDLGFPAYFSGAVLRSSLGTVPILYSDQLAETDEVRRQLINGAPLATMVTVAEPTAGPAPILMLAARDRLSEIAALGQTGANAFFRVRTRAAAVGLRNPSIRLDDAFIAGAAKDTVALTGQYADGRYRITADHPGRHRERTLAASPSWMWALLVPIPHYSFGTEVRWLTALWVFAPLCLAGFWSGQGSDRVTGRTLSDARLLMITLLALTIGVGLGVVPIAFDLPVSHWSEWTAAIAGAACGWAIARHARPRDLRAIPSPGRIA